LALPADEIRVLWRNMAISPIADSSYGGRRVVHGDMLAMWQRGLERNNSFYSLNLKTLGDTETVRLWSCLIYLKWCKSTQRDGSNAITFGATGEKICSNTGFQTAQPVKGLYLQLKASYSFRGMQLSEG
jgi:hypothetical protein